MKHLPLLILIVLVSAVLPLQAHEVLKEGTQWTVAYITGETYTYTLEAPEEIDGVTYLPLTWDFHTLGYVRAELVDAEGNVVPDADRKLTAEVSGAAALQAFGSPRPDSTEVFTAGTFTSFEGRALAVLRAGTAAGTAALEVTSPQLGQVRVELPVLARS